MKLSIRIILIVSLSAGFIYWLGNYIEYYDHEVDTGFSGEAKANHFLAAEYFLKTMGQDAKKVDVYRQELEFLDQEDTLIMTSHRVSMGKNKSNELIDWVNSGGSLIVTALAYAEDDDRTHDYLLDSLGIGASYQYTDDEDFKDYPVDVVINDDIEFLLVGFKRYYTLKLLESFSHKILWSIEHDSSLHGITISLGKGRIVVLSDMSILHNSEISKYDNAAFIWGLINDNKNIGNVYYSLFETRETLLFWLYSETPMLLVSLLLLVLLFLWHVTPRYGPIINLDNSDRRSFKEHILASGNYYWRKKDYSKLVSFCQKSILHKIYARHPELVMNDRQQLIDVLKKSVSENDIDFNTALFDHNASSQEHFLQKIKLLENIRKAI